MRVHLVTNDIDLVYSDLVDCQDPVPLSVFALAGVSNGQIISHMDDYFSIN